MCYLEEHERKWIRILNPTYATCSLHFYNRETKDKLKAINPIMAKILDADSAANAKEKPKDGGGGGGGGATVKFPVIDLAADNGWQGYLVKRELKNMQWSTFGSGGNKRNGMVVEFSDL